MKTTSKLYNFVDGKLDSPMRIDERPTVGVPCIYILSESGLLNPIYVGEYGKSQTYNVIKRIELHFSKTSTLGRLSKNLTAFGRKVPKRITAFVVELDECFRNDQHRKSFESWVVAVVCHQKKIQDHRFAGVKFSAPNFDYEDKAHAIVCEYLKPH